MQGKILAAKYARENRVPYLGICLGMQIAVIEFARSILGLQDANSTEFDPKTRNPCVIFMPEVIQLCYSVEIENFETLPFLVSMDPYDVTCLQGSKTHMGGTMRLGSRRTYFQALDSVSEKLYVSTVEVTFFLDITC